MIRENNRHHCQIVRTSIYGLLSKNQMWIMIFLICCELNYCVDGGVLTITSRIEKDQLSTICSNTNLNNQTTWELHELCCQNLFLGQTCPLACPCRHGSKCIPELKQCQCKAGFVGPRCEQTCRTESNRTWGENCNTICHCGPDAECDQYMGVCQCVHENRCNRRCKKHRYGPRCEKVCTECRDQGLECNAYSGQCQVSSFTRDTSNSCGCKNGGRCLSTGKCDCYEGFHGSYCQLTCPENFYGRNCRSSCNCGKNAICTPDVGRCRCRHGLGYDCQDRCPVGSFGPRCEYRCECAEGLLCDQVNGNCYSPKDIVKIPKTPAPLKDEGLLPILSQAPIIKALKPTDNMDRLLPTISQTTRSTGAPNYRAPMTNPPPNNMGITTMPTTPKSTTPAPQTTRVIPTTSQASQPTHEIIPLPSRQIQKVMPSRQIQKVRLIQSDQNPMEPPPSLDGTRTAAPPPLPTTKPTTEPTTVPQKIPMTTSAYASFLNDGYIYHIQNGSGPLDIQNSNLKPAVITRTIYPNNKLWGVLAMIGMLLVILVILLATLLVKKTIATAHVTGEIRGPKKFLQEDNIYETVSELQRNSALHQALHHPLLLALSSAPSAPTSPRPMSPPLTPRPSTPSSPCPGTPLLGAHNTAISVTPQSIRRSESSTKVRNCNDTLPKPPAKMASMRVAPQEGVELRAKINAKRPRSKSINGLVGIPGMINYDSDSNTEEFSYEPEKSARFSFLVDDNPDGAPKKKPFYFVLEADDKGKTLDSGYDEIEAYIPGTPEDREKTLELAKQGIIYSTVERKKRQRIKQEIVKSDNYECPTDIKPKSEDSSLVRRDSRKRIVKETFAPIAGESNEVDHTYGKLQHSSSTGHIYGRLVPNSATGSRELIDDIDYDQVERPEPAAASVQHTVTHEAEVYSDNIYDHFDRKNEDIVVDASGQLQRKDSKRGGQSVYDRVQRQESFVLANKIKPKIRDRDHNYDHVERKDGVFTPVPSNAIENVDNIEQIHIPQIQENVYGHLKGVGASGSNITKQKLSQRKDFGSKLLNKFKFGAVRNNAPQRRKNITYADFWLDFSLKKRVEEYLQATNSLPRDLDKEGCDIRDIASVSGSPFGSMDIVIEDEENWVTIDKIPDGYESVIEPINDSVTPEESLQHHEFTQSLNSNSDVDMHSALQTRYSSIQEHMQAKFLERSPRPGRAKRESPYAELRSIRKQYSLQVRRPLPASPEAPSYDQFKRPDKKIRHVRSASDTAILSISEVASYQQLQKNATLENHQGYDHLDRNYGGSRPDLADESIEADYGHLDPSNDVIDYDITGPRMTNSMNLPTEDGWVIVPPKIHITDMAAENRNSIKSTGSRTSHQYSNTSMYEEIWPGQVEKK